MIRLRLIMPRYAVVAVRYSLVLSHFVRFTLRRCAFHSTGCFRVPAPFPFPTSRIRLRLRMSTVRQFRLLLFAAGHAALPADSHRPAVSRLPPHTFTTVGKVCRAAEPGR